MTAELVAKQESESCDQTQWGRLLFDLRIVLLTQFEEGADDAKEAIRREFR